MYYYSQLRCVKYILLCENGDYSLQNLCRALDRMVVGFTSTCPISAYHYLNREFEPRSWRGVLDTTICDKVCQ